jgi:hypothetical protein
MFAAPEQRIAEKARLFRLESKLKLLKVAIEMLHGYLMIGTCQSSDFPALVG